MGRKKKGGKIQEDRSPKTRLQIDSPRDQRQIYVQLTIAGVHRRFRFTGGRSFREKKTGERRGGLLGWANGTSLALTFVASTQTQAEDESQWANLAEDGFRLISCYTPGTLPLVSRATPVLLPLRGSMQWHNCALVGESRPSSTLSARVASRCGAVLLPKGGGLRPSPVTPK